MGKIFFSPEFLYHSRSLTESFFLQPAPSFWGVLGKIKKKRKTAPQIRTLVFFRHQLLAFPYRAKSTQECKRQLYMAKWLESWRETECYSLNLKLYLGDYPTNITPFNIVEASNSNPKPRRQGCKDGQSFSASGWRIQK